MELIRKNAIRISLWSGVFLWLSVVLATRADISSDVTQIGFFALSIYGIFGIILPLKHDRNIKSIAFWLGIILNAVYVVPSLVVSLLLMLTIITGASV